ncbi:hypothetical protein CK203_003313 [Vitis vinifera]|uniref:Uncharacterized protein n=1 Tax=Vitis vinifera TaxID=29760 RepID=A0A438K6N6_VITVI|nr:hypothetical protein CK203_003313 [Vitis vinifera]
MKETACFGCQLSLVSSQLGVSFVDCGMIVECAEMFARSEYMFLSEIDLSVVHPGYYTIAAVTEGSIEDYEEGIQACSKAAKLWMKVRSSSLRFIAF